MSTDLRQELRAYDRWADAQPRDTDGWETFYPRWEALVRAALDAMGTVRLSDAAVLDQIARVWSITEETEDLREAVRLAPDLYARVLPALCGRADWKGRFQMYALGAWIESLGESFVLQGLEDDHPYVVRRALIALDEMNTAAARSHAGRFVGSEDEDLRRLAQEILRR